MKKETKLNTLKKVRQFFIQNQAKDRDDLSNRKYKDFGELIICQLQHEYPDVSYVYNLDFDDFIFYINGDYIGDAANLLLDKYKSGNPGGEFTLDSITAEIELCEEPIKIFNGTPHAINIITGAEFSPQIRKYIGGEVVRSIPSSGLLNAKFEVTENGNLDGNIPLYKKSVTGCDPLPEGYDLYIVSAIYAVAYRQVYGANDKVYTIADPVVESAEKPNNVLGCIGVMPAL